MDVNEERVWKDDGEYNGRKSPMKNFSCVVSTLEIIGVFSFRLVSVSARTETKRNLLQMDGVEFQLGFRWCWFQVDARTRQAQPR